MTKTFLVFFLFLILITSVQARTRLEGIENYLEESRLSDDGYGENNQIDLASTFFAISTARILGIEVNNTEDILYYIQRLQDSSGGFSDSINSTTTWDATYDAVRTLQLININRSQLINWQIFPFINSTAESILYKQNGNQTSLADIGNTLKQWIEFIEMTSMLGISPGLPILELRESVKSLQFPNGSYTSFSQAIYSIKLLSFIGEKPEDPDLAAKFIKAFITSKGVFTDKLNGEISLLATYRGLSALTLLDKLNIIDDQDEIVNSILEQQQANSGMAEYGNNEVSLEATWYAVSILDILNAIPELFAPDVLQEVGFVNYNIIGFAGILVMIIWRKFK